MSDNSIELEPLADHILGLLERLENHSDYKRVRGGWVKQ